MPVSASGLKYRRFLERYPTTREIAPPLEIRAENLCHTFNPGTPLELKALDNVCFTLPTASILGILGGTGSGKTTLVRHLNGLLFPTQGRVLLDQVDTRSFRGNLGRTVGVVFQRPERHLFEETVFLDISYVLRRFTALSEHDVVTKVRDACEMVRLDIDEIGQRSPLALSGGEKRKVAIAGMLVNEPAVMALDEPAVGLDPPSLDDLVNLLEDTRNRRGCTVLIVSHDMEPFLPVLDFLMVLHHGCMAAFGAPAEVCSMLGDDPVMREHLPQLAILAHELRNMGIPLRPGEFRISAMANVLEDTGLFKEKNS